jgi:sugar phosphate isomerase/epimerase
MYRFIKLSGIFVLTFAVLACGRFASPTLSAPSEGEAHLGSEETGGLDPTIIPPTAPENAGTAAADKWSLWTAGHGTQLRGANIWQRIVVPELDGSEFLGSGYIGPPYKQADFDNLAALGANYVNLSHPGLFTERSPYVLDEQVQANLDGLIEMAAQADIFVVITFRTGPGRSDFTFYRDGAGNWFDKDLLIESVWTDQEAQDAWVEMWRYTAERYRAHPVVVGYDLMCEPNSNDVALGFYNPEDFYPKYAGSTYDWNQFYPRIVKGIREVDSETPILVSAMNWGGVRWLPSLKPIDDPRIIYIAHQYEPQSEYTHQEPPAVNTYPGKFDLNWDGKPDLFDRAWLEDFLSILTDFQKEHGVPVAVNEFGVMRWEPGAADFMRDEMDIFEELGINHALWVWNPDWAPWAESVSEMNFRYGPDPENAAPMENDLQAVILEFWARNTVRPSNLNP